MPLIQITGLQRDSNGPNPDEPGFGRVELECHPAYDGSTRPRSGSIVPALAKNARAGHPLQ
jgi:hypothetical protein